MTADGLRVCACVLSMITDVLGDTRDPSEKSDDARRSKRTILEGKLAELDASLQKMEGDKDEAAAMEDFESAAQLKKKIEVTCIEFDKLSAELNAMRGSEKHLIRSLSMTAEVLRYTRKDLS